MTTIEDGGLGGGRLGKARTLEEFVGRRLERLGRSVEVASSDVRRFDRHASANDSITLSLAFNYGLETLPTPRRTPGRQQDSHTTNAHSYPRCRARCWTSPRLAPLRVYASRHAQELRRASPRLARLTSI